MQEARQKLGINPDAGRSVGFTTNRTRIFQAQRFALTKTTIFQLKLGI
jgi:hypothetical protein